MQGQPCPCAWTSRIFEPLPPQLSLLRSAQTEHRAGTLLPDQRRDPLRSSNCLQGRSGHLCVAVRRMGPQAGMACGLHQCPEGTLRPACHPECRRTQKRGLRPVAQSRSRPLFAQTRDRIARALCQATSWLHPGGAGGRPAHPGRTWLRDRLGLHHRPAGPDTGASGKGYPAGA